MQRESRKGEERTMDFDLSDEQRQLKDSLDRPLRNLRLSVTDRCNLRCSYCMPEAEYVWLPRHDILQFEEMSTLVSLLQTSSCARTSKSAIWNW